MVLARFSKVEGMERAYVEAMEALGQVNGTSKFRWVLEAENMERAT